MSDQRIWAWVSEYPDGTVGAVGAFIPDMGLSMALQARSLEMAMSLRPFAKSHSQQSGQRVWLRRYDTWTDLEEA